MNTNSNWYAIYTKPRAEKKVYKSLVENGFEAYLPLMTTIRQWSDRKKKVQLPLIPSYVFIKIEKNKLNHVLPIQGIVKILKHLGEPAKIRDYEIDNLKILLQDTDNIQFSEIKFFEKGDKVLVDKGIFKGLIAECLQHKGKHRIIIRIQGIENTIEVNVPINHVNYLS